MGSVYRATGERQPARKLNKQGRMTKPIVLLLALAVVLSVFLPALDAASVRRRSRNQSVSGRNRLSSARNSRRASVRSFRARNNKLRRGRQEEEELSGYDYEAEPADYDLAGDASEVVEEEVAAEASEAVEDEVAAEASDAVESSDIPTWCDPAQNLAAFLLFPKLKCWCVDNGYGPEFGPYGSGCPADDVDNALDAGASETVEEEVSLEDVLAEDGDDYVEDAEAAVEEARRRRGRSQKRGRKQKKGRSQKKGRKQRKGKAQQKRRNQKKTKAQ